MIFYPISSGQFPLYNLKPNRQFKTYSWNFTTFARRHLDNGINTEFKVLFARRHLDMGINTEFKVQLTHLYNRPAFSQSLPAPINFRDDILVELALLYKYGNITILPFSNYASPIFAQRKPNGKLRLLVDLRKINTLIADDYINNKHPVSTLTDAAQHMVEKNLFCQLD